MTLNVEKTVTFNEDEAKKLEAIMQETVYIIGEALSNGDYTDPEEEHNARCMKDDAEQMANVLEKFLYGGK